MIVILVLVLGIIAAFGFFGFYVLFSTERKQKKAEAEAPRILNAAFDGRHDVSFPMDMTTLKYETVVTGAKARGYHLAHQSSNQYGPTMLVFEKI